MKKNLKISEKEILDEIKEHRKKKRKWEVDFDPEFLKQLDKLPDDVRKKIHKSIKELSESDDPKELGEPF